MSLPFHVNKWLIIWPVSKGVTMGATVIAVVNSGLSPFAQAIIIAIVSAAIGASGVIIAALIAVGEAREQRGHLESIQRTGEDIKQAVGADRRKRDDNGHDHPS